MNGRMTGCLLLMWVVSQAPGAGQVPTPGEVRLELTRPGQVQELTLRDGSRLYGRVTDIQGARIVFVTISGSQLEITPEEILRLRVAPGREVRGEFFPDDPNPTRLFFAPTARALPKGEGYFGVYEVMMPFLQIGLTDRISIGGGTPLFFGGGSDHPFWLTPKVQVLNRNDVATAVGVIHVMGIGHPLGIAYGVGTFGSSERALTAGVGYGYSGHERQAIVMIGGEARATRRLKFITENWIWHGGDGFLSGGIRLMGDRLSADVGLIVPLGIGEFVAAPMVNFVWRF